MISTRKAEIYRVIQFQGFDKNVRIGAIRLNILDVGSLKSNFIKDKTHSVPWIFKVAFRIVEYVVSHKRESAFYAFILFFTIYMISSMVSRKN